MKSALSLRIARLLIWILVVLSTWTDPRVRAAAPAEEFDRANRLYEQAKYREAIDVYNQLIKGGFVTAAVYFNLGNACFKSGQAGQAIAAYRVAEQLDPRDPDVRDNLRFAREAVGGSVQDSGLFRRGLALFTLNELTIVGALLLWASLALFALGNLRPEWAKALKPYAITFALMLLVALVWLAAALRMRLANPAAVVISQEAAVKYGPFEEAQTFFSLKDGAELAVLNSKDDWLQVQDNAKRIGWTQRKNLVLLPKG